MKLNFKLSGITSSVRWYGRHIRPTRDWFVLLVLFFIALTLSVIWNVLLFSRVTNGQAIDTSPQSKPAEINTQSVQTLFTSRENARLQYVSDYRFVDPSL